MDQEPGNMSQRKPRRCPVCGLAKVARILWGLFPPTAAQFKALDEGSVVLGGCCIPHHAPSWLCTGCGAQIYPEELRESNGRWYFAYGSNLHIEQKASRTGAIRASVRCRLPGHRFAFNKRAASGGGVYANVIPDRSATVWGAAYLCNQAAIAALDRYEGVSGGHYRHQAVEVVTDGGKVLQAITYVAGDEFICPAGRPRADYLHTILAGARDHELPWEYIGFVDRLGGGLQEEEDE